MLCPLGHGAPLEIDMTKAAIPDRVEAVVLPHVCWLMDSALYDECDDLCPTCARAVADAEPCAIVQGGDPARECDSPTTCERCGCCLSCTVGGVEIYTDEDWQNATHDGN